MDERVVERGGITARYLETETERLLTITSDGAAVTIAQNRDGYAMLKVRRSPEGDELERYYGFDMALDHVAELLGIRSADIPVPEAAADMGM